MNPPQGEIPRPVDKRTIQELLALLRRDADRVCAHFGLRYRAIEAERANVKRRYGICYEDGTIRVRLRNVKTGAPLKYSSLVSTLCHELAHLRHFDHGPRFQQLNEQILEWCRREGIYRPGPMRAPVPALASASSRLGAVPAPPRAHAAARGAPRPAAGPRQLDLFV